MKKFKLGCTFAAVLAIGGSLFATSCGESGETGDKTYEYALITDVGDIDDEGFNQSSWEAMKAYAEKIGRSCTYYRPTEDSNDARKVSMEQAIKKGAKVVVCPGYLFESPVYDMQDKYPEVKFILLDGAPHSEDYSTYKTGANVVGYSFQEHISGFLAGFAAVKDGNVDLGFCGGMALPAVQRFGSGYVQGIEAASKELGIKTTCKYYYAGAFQATDEATSNMKSWYTAGIDTVFACGGKVYQSVTEGIKNASKSSATWIGVDVDQHSVSDKVLTSAMKGLRETVTSTLELYEGGSWSLVGGETPDLGLATKLGNLEAKDYVGLPTDDAAWRFKSFSKSDLEAVIAGIKSGKYTVSSDVTKAPETSACTVTWVSKFAD